MRVCVIGAGVIGAAIAETLAVRGADVHVIDMRSPGRGASFASAGVLAPLIEAGAAADPALLDQCRRSFEMFDDFVAGVSARSRRAIEFRHIGTLQVALNQEQSSHLSAARDWLESQPIAIEWFEAADIARIDRAVTPSAVAALRIPAHAYVSVGDLIAALVQSARAAGATFESPVEAAEIALDGAAPEVHAAGRRYTADRVVMAAGSWSNRIRVRGAVLPGIRPIRGQLLHLEWRDATMPRHVIWGERCYVVPWKDGSVLVGATVEDVGFDESTTVEGVRGLLDAVSEILPGARLAALRDVRVGLRPMAEEHLPCVGPLAAEPRIIMAAGHYRNGILLAPLTAARVAESIFEGGIS